MTKKAVQSVNMYIFVMLLVQFKNIHVNDTFTSVFTGISYCIDCDQEIGIFFNQYQITREKVNHRWLVDLFKKRI